MIRVTQEGEAAMLINAYFLQHHIPSRTHIDVAERQRHHTCKAFGI
jgi:hypothetical protein